MKRKSLRIAIVFWVMSLGIFPHLLGQDTLRVMVYNLLKYGIAQSGCTPLTPAQKNPYLKTIFADAHPDILGVNEIGTNSLYADNILQNVLWTIDSNYARCTHTNFAGADESNHLFYNSAKLGLISQNVISHWLRDLNVYHLYYKDPNLAFSQDTAKLVVLVVHLKAGSTASDATTRQDQADLIMNYLGSLGGGQDVLVMGDFNIQSSSEDCYQTFTANSNTSIRLFDPINQPGNWNSNSSFASIHTQSTRANAGTDCGSSGGMDDRFDFILSSNSVYSGTNQWGIVPGSYKAFGNDGLHYNGNINTNPSNAVVSSAVANALYSASDHLPVRMDLAVEGIPIGVNLSQGRNLTLDLAPNPSEGTVKLELEGCLAGVGLFQVMDVQGRVLKTMETPLVFGRNSVEWDLSGLPSGVFWVEFKGEGGQFVVKKLIKR